METLEDNIEIAFQKVEPKDKKMKIGEKETQELSLRDLVSFREDRESGRRGNDQRNNTRK